MNFKKNLKFFLTVVVLSATTAVRAEKHAFSPLDLVTFNRISSHSISPNYEYILYDTIGFLSTRSGSSQLWYSTLDFDNLDLIKENKLKQLTKLTTSINNIEYNQKAKRLLFSAQAYLNGTLVNDDTYVEQEDNKYTTGIVYDKLFIRHWDTFLKPSVREQLFVLDLRSKNNKFSLKHQPVNIMNGNELESPVSPFGDSGDFSISPDGQTIAFSSRIEEHSQAWKTNTDVFLVKYPIDGKPSAVENLTKSNPGYDNYPNISPDGQWIAYLEMREENYESDKNRVMLYNIKRKTHTELPLRWDRSPESLTWSADSNSIYLTAYSKGRVKVYVVNLKEALIIIKKKGTIPTLAVKELIGTGNNDTIEVIPKRKLGNNSGEIIVFGRSSFTKPRDIYKLEVPSFDKLKTENEKRVIVRPPKSEAGITQITNVNDKFKKEVIVSEPEEFYFKGHNDELIHGWYLKPVNFDESKKYPLAFLIHGGPQGSWNEGFSSGWNVQSYAGAGYAVAAINFHGSTGFGQEFVKAVSKNWGGDSYNDLMKGLDYVLKTHKYIDKSKVCGLGASYGGYMINWINGHTDRFACLVNHDGVFDTINTFFTTEELFFSEYEFGGVPWDKKAKKIYDKWNPREFVKNWKTPTLVIHGGKDYRLTESEGIATFTALQRLGVKSKFLYYPDENHWVLKPANTLFWQTQIIEWIDSFTK
ncbi:peptidase S9 prolyl oligopeptidase active site domain-containing protein [Neocallimastix sp. 'constans']